MSLIYIYTRVPKAFQLVLASGHWASVLIRLKKKVFQSIKLHSTKCVFTNLKDYFYYQKVRVLSVL